MTAVEFLVQRLAENGILHSSDISKAKEIEKQQIELAHIDGGKNKRTSVNYYNETFKSE